MASTGQQSEWLNTRLLVDSIPALIHTGRPDLYLDYFNKRWPEYPVVTLDEVAGWNWTAVVHPEDVEGILTKWRACLRGVLWGAARADRRIGVASRNSPR